MKDILGQRGEMLLAIFKYTWSLTTLQDKGWYHIPKTYAPKIWPPKWLCFYQGKIFGEEAYRVKYYGELESYETVPYKVLFPNQIESEKGDLPYYRVRLKELKQLSPSIPSFRPRRLTFIPTTWAKFESAEQINDLFDESPLEDLMWHQLKRLEIKAERQWEFPIKKKRYFLDFAIFCQQGFIDVEADGDTWHARTDRISSDNERNNQLAKKGWRILRYNGKQIRATSDYCIKEVQETINDLGGLSDEGLVPRIFYQQGNQPVQQLSMFESRAPYHLDSGAVENLEM